MLPTPHTSLPVGSVFGAARDICAWELLGHFYQRHHRGFSGRLRNNTASWHVSGLALGRAKKTLDWW